MVWHRPCSLMQYEEETAAADSGCRCCVRCRPVDWDPDRSAATATGVRQTRRAWPRICLGGWLLVRGGAQIPVAPRLLEPSALRGGALDWTASRRRALVRRLLGRRARPSGARPPLGSRTRPARLRPPLTGRDSWNPADKYGW